SPTTTEHWEDDVAALSRAEGLRGVMLAETERPEQVTYTAMRLRAGTPVIALVESALGVENATQIASAPGTFRLAFGTNDFRKDVGVSAEPMALAYARSRLVIASRVGGLPGAIDGPTAADADTAAIDAACQVTADMGMTGKLSLNRAQVEQVNQGLSPSEDELRWARELIEAHESGASIGDGSYLPRLARAQKIASLADSYGLWNA
ncbi:MAG TPA: CoA ester lyase, partial [Candidatus Nesterenkonia stercoripullorum]|nr:CoA ester lyase [Candidatus Nesterenkonia stercoripullorum]